MTYGSGEGSSPSDPPFAQLQGASRSWGDVGKVFGAAAFESLADDDTKRAFRGAGDTAAFLKRNRAMQGKQQFGISGAERQQVRDAAYKRLKEFGGGD